MAHKKLLPQTRLGKWGFGLIILAMILVVISMLTAQLLRDPEHQTAYNVLGILAPVFILVTLVALVLSWMAIIRAKDRGLLLIVFASVLSIITLFFAVGEILESIMAIGK
jgi:lysylphosphatidylglycerol synthetase-like protein (DUF2156 family)